MIRLTSYYSKEDIDAIDIWKDLKRSEHLRRALRLYIDTEKERRAAINARTSLSITKKP